MKYKKKKRANKEWKSLNGEKLLIIMGMHYLQFKLNWVLNKLTDTTKPCKLQTVYYQIALLLPFTCYQE